MGLGAGISHAGRDLIESESIGNSASGLDDTGIGKQGTLCQGRKPLGESD